MRYLLPLLLLAAPLVAQDDAGPLPDLGGKLYFPPCAPFAAGMAFDCYRDFSEVEQFLVDAARQYPGLTELESIGTSYEGRTIHVLTITDKSTGPADAKPALWVDGGVDSDEVISTEVALGLIHRLLTSDDPDVVALRQTRTFYISPNIIPDTSERHHRTPMRPRDSTMKPWDDDGDGLFDEDGPEDLDGDNMALQMRVIDPSGNWVLEESDPRLMRPRRMDDSGPFYSRYSEGLDSDGDGEYNEDWPGGIDPNRNYPGNWSISQRGSGPFPGSESELRATLDFIYDHPNIAASQHLHSTGGVILRPPSAPNEPLPASDLNLYIALSERGLDITGYNLATSVYDWNWPRGARNTRKGQIYRKPDGTISGTAPFVQSNSYGEFPEEDTYAALGGSLDGLYRLFGILSFANEIYQFGEDLNGDGRISPVERLKHDDEHMNGEVFKDWTAFNHPTLGEVEIGGWKKWGQNNPLPQDLPREVERNVAFMLMQARAMPLLELDVTSASLGDGVTRVTGKIRNSGYQPTELAVRVQSGRAVPVRTRLEPGEGVTLLSEDAQIDAGQLSGHSETKVSWLVKGSGSVTVVAVHPKAGTSSMKVFVP